MIESLKPDQRLLAAEPLPLIEMHLAKIKPKEREQKKILISART
jgi:hypothetical protein